MKIITALRGLSRELKLFIAASLMLGVATSIVDSTFNNFLNARFALSGFERSFLEFPRELPGLLVIFVAALLSFLCSRRLSALAMLLCFAGSLLIGFYSTSYIVMVFWLFIYSMGIHLFLPLQSSIGMELATDGKTGQRLGQLNAVRNLATIGGSFLVFITFRYLGATFKHTFLLAAIAFLGAAVLIFSMKKDRPQPSRTFLTLHKEYKLYYLLAILYGSRKQIFLTFAPWVLVTVFKQPTQTLATLMTIGGVVGILFQPLLGWATDHLGERFVLATEGVLLFFVCGAYALAKSVFPESIALVVVCVCYLLDQVLMSVNMARATYLKKIARVDSDVQAALSAGVSIDHIFSISIALLGGVIWNVFGFQYVFYFGAVIALIDFVVALQVRVPHPAPIQAVEEISAES